MRPALAALLLPFTALAQLPGTFAQTGRMAVARYQHTATLLNDGRVLIAGGDSSYGALGTEASAELYDPATGTFTATGRMTTPRKYHTATLLPNGKVLIAGGGLTIPGLGYSLASAELYDPATGTFTATGRMTVERTGHTATLLNNGKVLIAGGLTGSAPPAYQGLSSAELYDPDTGIFTATNDMNGVFADTATLLPNGEVLITRSNSLGPPPLSFTDIFDSSTGVFLPTGRMVYGGTSPTAAMLLNGKVLLAGGDMGDGEGGWDKAELYDYASGTFAATGRMTVGREEDATVLLPDGTVLFAGGHGGGVNGDNDSRSEIYNPATGAFSATGSMLTGRDWLNATLLNSGQVLITGGNEYYPVSAGSRDPQHPEVATAELYTPAVLIPPPALLSLSGDGEGQGAILHGSTQQLVSADNPAAAGEAVEIYLTGLTDGGVISPRVVIGDRMAEVLFFGNAPGYVRLDQINVRVPSGVTPGPTVSVRLNYLGRTSNEVTIGVQ
jgi:hypothetical protein